MSRLPRQWHEAALSALTAATILLTGCGSLSTTSFVHDDTQQLLIGGDPRDPLFDGFRVDGAVLGVLAVPIRDSYALTLPVFGGGVPADVSVESVDILAPLRESLPIVAEDDAVREPGPNLAPTLVAFIEVASLGGDVLDAVLETGADLELQVRVSAGGSQHTLLFRMRRLDRWFPPTV